MSEAQVIPFGKYRGQPVEILQSDRQYVEWLLLQPWFSQRYGSIKQMIAGAIEEASCTPEHNAMQSRFLNKELIFNLAMKSKKAQKLKREYPDLTVRVETKFEELNWDVCSRLEFRSEFMADDMYISVELKPSIGDDFPSILRTVKARRVIRDRHGDFRAVISDSFESEAVDIKQAKEMFFMSGVALFLFSEISNTTTSKDA